MSSREEKKITADLVEEVELRQRKDRMMYEELLSRAHGDEWSGADELRIEELRRARETRSGDDGEQSVQARVWQLNAERCPDDGPISPVHRPGTELHREIGIRFDYHEPRGDQPQRYDSIRFTAKELAYRINVYTPKSREQSLAITKLEEAVMWANAAIARREE